MGATTQGYLLTIEVAEGDHVVEIVLTGKSVDRVFHLTPYDARLLAVYAGEAAGAAEAGAVLGRAMPVMHRAETDDGVVRDGGAS